MAKVRYHLGPQGPGVCRVDLSNPRSKGCPFGGESGSENHFATMAEAESAYAEQMETSGNGLVAASTSAVAKVGPLEERLKGVFRGHFNTLIADSSYGVSHDSKLGFIADSSEGLERLRSAFVTRTSDELDPEVDYADSDGEIIRSVYIKELDIEIENQNLEDDLDQLAFDREMVASNGREYWR